MLYNNKYGLTFIPTMTVAALSCYFLLQRWNPYTLNGKPFLHFYIALLLITYAGYALSLVWRRQNALTLKYFPAVWIWIGIGGLLRLAQGILNERPVGFLLLLLFGHLVSYYLVRKSNNRIQKKH